MTKKQMATAAFENVEPELRAISRWLYENPEIAYQEFASSKRLAEFLAGIGFDVTYPAYGLETSFEANVGTAGPRVIICAEYDALPEVGHACGHNLIATSSLGAAAALAGLVDDLGIRLTVLGTPAEEGGGGKLELIEAGAFEDGACSMMVHPSQRNVADPRIIAAQGFTVEFKGKEAHAAASPQAGINALDAFVQAYNNISTLRQHFESGDRVHGVIDEGGVAPNVIPAHTSSRWIVRAQTVERFETLKEKVMSCFEAAAQATGCELSVSEESKPYIDLVSSETMAELFTANSRDIGREMLMFADDPRPVYASTDMGNVSHVLPSIHPSLEVETDAVNHQPEFAAATITPSGEQVITDGALAMAHTVIDIAEQGLWESI